jgi:hypothetical protein
VTTPTAQEMGLAPAVVAAWRDRMATDALGLDLTVDEDRAAFRMRMVVAMRGLRTSAAIKLAWVLGGCCPGNASHHQAVRACCKAWIEGATRGR